jgi:hypothetical protein
LDDRRVGPYRAALAERNVSAHDRTRHDRGEVSNVTVVPDEGAIGQQDMRPDRCHSRHVYAVEDDSAIAHLNTAPEPRRRMDQSREGDARTRDEIRYRFAASWPPDGNDVMGCVGRPEIADRSDLLDATTFKPPHRNSRVVEEANGVDLDARISKILDDA